MSMPEFDAIKPAVQSIPPYTLAALDTPVKLNQNENPYDVPEGVKREILAYALERPWSRYPDFVPDEFLTLLAGHVGWKPDGMLAGNGSNELIQAILSITCEPGRNILICQPTFTLYKLLGTVNGAEVNEVFLRDGDLRFDLPALLDSIKKHQPSVVILCSPNNPTGSTLSLDDWRAVCEAAPGLVLADQAYVEFGGDSAIPLLSDYDNLVVLRTFSKAGGLAGLRVGYCACAPELAEQISKAKLPYNLNFFTMAAAGTIIRKWDRFTPIIEELVGERERVRAAMQTIEGVTVHPSQANFLLFETPRRPGDVFGGIYQQGVLIRDVSKYPMLGQALRVSIGTPAENDLFLKALRLTMENMSHE
jgi:histidinol-phosphate aminotransferase